MDEVTITKLINGPEAFTPDNEFCLGETEVAGFFVAAGFCAHGLAGAGGIGKVIAEWIVGGEPEIDLWHMDIRRFGAQYRSPSYTHARVKETYETYYDIRYPNHEREAGRPLRVSPANAWHREHDAAFGEKSGWERVNWYESNAEAGDESLRPRGWAGQHWSPAIGAEHLATREAAAIFDESSFAKLEIVGPGAAAYVERLCDNEVARDAGQDHLHPDAEHAAAGSSATSPSPGWTRTASRSSPEQPSATTTASGSAATLVGTAAAYDTRAAIGPRPGRAIRRRAGIAVLVAVLRPLPHVAMHVVQSERVGRERAGRRGLLVVPHATAPVAVGAASADFIAPGVDRAAASARRIFPFGLAEQAIGPAGLSRQPGQIGIRHVIPGHIDHRLTFPSETTITRHMTAGALGNAGVPFREGDLELADRKGARQRDVVNGCFIAAHVRPHGESAGRHHYHLGARRAVLERIPSGSGNAPARPRLPSRQRNFAPLRRRSKSEGAAHKAPVTTRDCGFAYFHRPISRSLYA